MFFREAATVTLALEGPTGSLERANLELPGRPHARQLNYTQRLHIGKQSCTNVTVNIRPGNVDYTTPVDVTMRFNLTDEASTKGRPN